MEWALEIGHGPVAAKIYRQPCRLILAPDRD